MEILSVDDFWVKRGLRRYGFKGKVK